MVEGTDNKENIGILFSYRLHGIHLTCSPTFNAIPFFLFFSDTLMDFKIIKKITMKTLSSWFICPLFSADNHSDHAFVR